MALTNSNGDLIFDSNWHIPTSKDLDESGMRDYVNMRMKQALFNGNDWVDDVDIDPKTYVALLEKTEKNFRHVRDYHQPYGHTDAFQEGMNERVVYFLATVARYHNLESIKTVFDVGACTGIEGVRFAEKLQNSNVYSFEPVPSSYENVLLVTKDVDNIHPYNIALSNYNGKTKLYFSYQNHGGSSILEPKNDINSIKTLGSKFLEMEVDVLTLKNWCETNNVDTVDLMWVDVQGSELNVFEGMEDLLKTTKGILVECSLQPYYKDGVTIDEVEKYLNEYGLELVCSKLCHALSDIEGDFIFIRKNEN